MKKIFFKQLPGNPAKARLDCMVLRGIGLENLGEYSLFERNLMDRFRHAPCVEFSYNTHIDMVVTVDNQEEACKALLSMSLAA